MGQYEKVNLVLPQEVIDAFTNIGEDLDKRNQYILQLRINNWSLQSIGEAVEMSRERIRQICVSTAEYLPQVAGLPLPTPPVKKEKEPKVYPEPSQKAITRLMELQPAAQSVRSNSPKYRAEAEEYTALVYKIYTEEGVSLFRLAKHLGITSASLRFRLARYGYLPNSKSLSNCYKPIIETNRAQLS